MRGERMARRRSRNQKGMTASNPNGVSERRQARPW